MHGEYLHLAKLAQQTARLIVGVQIADQHAAAMKKHHQRQGMGIGDFAIEQGQIVAHRCRPVAGLQLIVMHRGDCRRQTCKHRHAVPEFLPAADRIKVADIAGADQIIDGQQQLQLRLQRRMQIFIAKELRQRAQGIVGQLTAGAYQSTRDALQSDKCWVNQRFYHISSCSCRVDSLTMKGL